MPSYVLHNKGSGVNKIVLLLFIHPSIKYGHYCSLTGNFIMCDFQLLELEFQAKSFIALEAGQLIFVANWGTIDCFLLLHSLL